MNDPMGMAAPMPPMGPPMGPPPMDPMMGGMGMDPMMGGMGMGMPSEEDMIMQALQGVLGKWASSEAVLGMEKGALLDTLMQIMQAQPPMAMDAMSMGGPPDAYGMAPPMGGPADPAMGGMGGGMPMGI